MYKFYNDIKEEDQERENLLKYFSVNEKVNGPRTFEDYNHITRAIFKHGKPVGLVVVKSKIDNTILHATFSEDGLPSGEWVLYNEEYKVLKKKHFNY